MKQLTITIPSYNMEKYLEKCLDSMCGIDDRLEVIVVNDGSKDKTSKIAHAYEEKYPLDVRVIDKENGGHGSGINAGLDAASGRYFKVVDADDWITTENLKPILDKLENTDVDAIIMGFKTVNVSNGVILEYSPVSNSSNRRIDMIKLNDKYDDVSSCLDFHSMCFNTEFLRSTGLRMSEHTYYEDQEFAILPFMHAESIMILPDMLYEYRIGDVHQSTNFLNQAKRVSNHQAVVERIVDYYISCKPMGKARDEFLRKRIAVAVNSNYATLLVKNPDKKEGRKKAAVFREYLLRKEPALVKMTDRRYKLFQRSSHFSKASAVYGKLFNSRSYAKFKDMWTK